MMNRRKFLAFLAAGGVVTASGMWLPGQKLISIPKDLGGVLFRLKHHGITTATFREPSDLRWTDEKTITGRSAVYASQDVSRSFKGAVEFDTIAAEIPGGFDEVVIHSESHTKSINDGTLTIQMPMTNYIEV